jgi:hypothetical protein
MQKQQTELLQCFQGHLYDANLAECPYCPDIDVFHGKTERKVADPTQSPKGGDVQGPTVMLGKENPPSAPPVGAPPSQESASPKTTILSDPVDPTPQKPEEEIQLPPAQEKSLYITVFRGTNTEESQLIREKAFIGSKEGNQIVINAPEIQPIHATITVVNGVVTLIDASGNGIDINGQKQHGRCTLKHNDRMTLGKTVLRVELV